MTERERYIETVTFGKPDRFPLSHNYGLMPSVIDRWHQEGLPDNVGEGDIYDHFGFDKKTSGVINVLSLYYPVFEEKIIEETDEYLIKIDANGCLEYPIKSPFSDGNLDDLIPLFIEGGVNFDYAGGSPILC